MNRQQAIETITAMSQDGMSRFFYSQAERQWMLIVPEAQAAECVTVTAVRRDGTTKKVKISQVVASSVCEGIPFATCRFVETHVPLTDAELDDVQVATWTQHSSECAECGRRERLYDAPDASGIHGRVCYRCSRLDRMERSYA